MRTFVPRLLPFVAVGLGALLSGQASAQPTAVPTGASENRLESAAADVLIANATGASEEPDEITVKGRQKDDLGRYRLKMTQSRDKIVEVFNRVNSNDDNDVKCRTEKPTGSRMGQSVCRSNAENAANAAAAKGMLNSFVYSTGSHPGGTGPGGGAQIGALKSQQEGAAAVYEARDKLEAELKTLMGQNRQLYRAVVEYVEAKDDYNKARGAGAAIFDADHPSPNN
jgi:hypothetical protein